MLRGGIGAKPYLTDIHIHTNASPQKIPLGEEWQYTYNWCGVQGIQLDHEDTFQ